ncbi:diguanylate cyclase [Pajaroellobacter abortibovis]|uniref:diguanylate cyclase n=1 Tax=Pajaroellobacter abortibovis TaxID=1882918 RepID=A0A1L6MW20_9BACT|nr:diguanylate cyclase [Pajaroellobacter abortibovis]APR99722.1 hypothetical protein BCY86_02815 [Pajaroellobacter abortibovis]
MFQQAVKRGGRLFLCLLLTAYGLGPRAFFSIFTHFLTFCALWSFLLLLVLRAKKAHTGNPLPDLELGLLLSIGTNLGLLYWDGTLDGQHAPFVFLLFLWIASRIQPWALGTSVAWHLCVEALIRHFISDQPPDSLGYRAGFLLGVLLLHLFAIHSVTSQTKKETYEKVNQEIARIQEDARSYRLLEVNKQTQAIPSLNSTLTQSSVEEIRQASLYALNLLHHSLHLHTAALLWLNRAGTHLRICQFVSEPGAEIDESPFHAGDGVLGAVTTQRKKLCLQDLKMIYHLPYYRGPCPIRSLLALPLLEHETLQGVLVVDRTRGEPFSPHEENLVMQAARFCIRTVQNERVFVQLEKTKIEQEKLYQAAQALGAALSEEDVLKVGLQATQEITSFDLAAVTIFDEASQIHEVRAVHSNDHSLDPLLHTRFAQNNSLVSMVVQNRYPLPYKGEMDGGQNHVLSPYQRWPKVASLLILPLLLHDRAMGTLILSSYQPRAFGDSIRSILEVLASHLVVSLSNARMIHQLERLATTDGLTGLLNKTAMLNITTQKITSAERSHQKLSLLILDIDFFKKVNDHYGHDTGDIVLQGIGAILSKQKRTTDVAARFGGEEFILLCEQTDEKGAMLLAERIREECAKQLFITSQKPLHVTCSLGISIFPDHGHTWDVLFKRADEALYYSKRSGRNRSTVWHSKLSTPPQERRDHLHF